MPYVPKVPEWQSNQALTAARLNEAVRALNYLLELAAQDSDTTAAAPTPISLDTPTGSRPPEAAPSNPEPFLITAAGQPFIPPYGGSAAFVIPPVAAFSALPSAPSFVGSAYYVTITTDPVGNQTTITCSSAPGENKPWDGSTGGSFSVCTGMSAVDEYGFPYSVDSNPIFLPVLPIPSVPPCGTATDSDGNAITAVSLVYSLTGNSVPIASLVAGAGVTITPGTTSSGAGFVKIEAETLPAANFNPLTDFAPSHPSWALYPENRPSPGGIRAVIEATDEETQTSPDAYPQIEDGVLKLTSSIRSVSDVTDLYGSTAEPGVDGWVLSLYLPSVKTGEHYNETMGYEKYRQLMRIRDKSLQLVRQYAPSEGAWHAGPY